MSGERTRALRMRTQRLDGRAGDVTEVVRHLVGIQAQDPAGEVRGPAGGRHADRLDPGELAG